VSAHGIAVAVRGPESKLETLKRFASDISRTLAPTSSARSFV
jgi:hypothetical protein